MLHGPDALRERLTEVGRHLVAHEAMWRELPFHRLECSWERDHPALSAWLRSRPAEVARAFDDDPRAAHGHPELDALRAGCARIAAVGALDPRGPAVDASVHGRHVPGRKWSQIESIVAAAPRAGHVVDWCAGKGHLGRTIGAATGASVVAVERDPSLAADAEVLARESGVDLVARVADVLTEPLDALFRPGVVVVGLHACGALTDAALRQAGPRDAQALLVPCCFHRVAGPYDGVDTEFPAASRLAAEVGPRVDWGMLRLPGRVEAFSRERRQILRQRAMAWRLALDLLVREATGEDRHTTPSSGERTTLEQSFAAWVRDVVERDGLSVPPRWDPARAEAAGWGRLAVVQALGAVATSFQREIALFWVLDRAIAVVEAGREDVAVGVACEEALTPRNLGLRLGGG